MKKYKMYIVKTSLKNLDNISINIININANLLIARECQNLYIKKMLKSGYKIHYNDNDYIVIVNNYEAQELTIVEY